LRQIIVALGVPGKGVLPQSANAQSPLGISTTPVRSPVILARDGDQLAFAVSRLSGARVPAAAAC
jgi:hypothetical protein